MIGILIRAKSEGRISSLEPELDKLRIRAGFWIARDLYRKVLASVGESAPTSTKSPAE